MTTSDTSPPPCAAETGKLLAEYGTGSALHLFILIGVPLLAALFVASWIYALVQWGVDVASAGFHVCTVLLLGMAGGLIVCWILAWAALRWRLLVFENGLHFFKKSSARWVPWHDVERYTEVHLVMNGMSTGHRLYLYPRQGKKVLIEGIFKDAPAAAAQIKACLLPALTRRAQERLARDEAVDFTFVQLSKDGLQTPKELVAWKDMESVAVEDNKGMNYQLRVRVPGKKQPWLSVPVSSFPNLEVFLHLVEQMPRR